MFVATDLSEPADEALREAHERAKAMSARLVVCHVVPSLLGVNMLFPQRSAGEARAEERLKRLALVALGRRTSMVTGRRAAEFDAIVDLGTPYARIVAQAEDANADLIVVGERGATGLTRTLIGNVAEQVVRHAHADVLVVRPGPRTGRVVAASDLSAPSFPALAAAERERRFRDARVTAVHAIEVVGPDRALSDGGSLKKRPGNRLRARAVKLLGEAADAVGLDCARHVLEGPPAPSIVKAAEDLEADLIIVASRGRTGLRRILLGNTAEAVVRHAHCSVMVIKIEDRIAGPA